LLGCVAVGPNQSVSTLLEDSAGKQQQLTPYERGKVELQLGRIGLAIDAFETALTLDPKSVPALNGMGVAYDRLGRGDIAERYLHQALTLDETSPVTLNNLALLELEKGDPAQALTYSARAKAVLAADMNMMYPEAVANAVLGNTAIASSLSESLEEK